MRLRPTLAPLAALTLSLAAAPAARAAASFAPAGAPLAPQYEFRIDPARSTFSVQTGAIGADPSLVQLSGTVVVSDIFHQEEIDAGVTPFGRRGRFYSLVG